MRNGAYNNHSGFTIAEILVVTATIGIITTAVLALLNFGLTLYARNVRVNMAHQQARNGMMRVVRDVHQSVSIPQLVDANLQPVNTSGPAAGATFQIVTNGPFHIMNDPAAAQLIQVETPNPNPAPPSVGDHLVVLDYNLETDIVDVTATGQGSNHWNIFLQNSAEQKIHNKKDSYLVCYITRRIGYVVSNGELRFYPNLIATPAAYSVVARNVTSATPFSIPLNQSGTPETRFTAIDLTVTEPNFSNRGYKSTSMRMADAGIPYRCQLTKYQ